MCDNKLNKFYPDTFITLKTNRTGQIRITILNEKDTF